VPLLVAHEFSKVLAVALVMLLGASLWRRQLAAPALAGGMARGIVLGVNLVAFVGLLAIYQALPLRHETPQALTGGQAAAFAGAIAALLGMLGSAGALILPEAAREYWRSPVAMGVTAATLAAITAVIATDALTIEAIRRPFEEATLALSLAFYAMTGMPEPTLALDGPDPILSSNGFAIAISPICSGYQGVFSAMAVLGAYIALERKELRIDRALLVVLAAAAGVFVLNAARIALLFTIGVNGAQEVAVNGFHSNFGTLSVFAVVILAFVALERAPFRHGAVAGPALALPADTLAELGRLGLPLAGLLASAIVVGLTVGTVNWLYPVSAAVGAALLWAVREDLMARLDPGPTVWGFVAGIVVFVLWVLIVPPDRDASRDFAAALMAAPAPLVGAWILVRVIGASVIVPLAEELAFRGGLMKLIALLLPAGWGAWAIHGLAILGSSLAFGLLHADILAGVVAGLVYGALAVWRGSLADAILAHAVTNFLLCLTVLGLGHWSYW
jgi:exosortase E/protease (VPEID-CTERM system)